jgi:hypothetical protein
MPRLRFAYGRRPGKPSDPTLLIQAMHPEVIYKSQWVFSALEGQEAAATYLNGKMDILRHLGSDAAVAVHVMPGAASTGNHGQACALTFQGTVNKRPPSRLSSSKRA